LRTSKLTVKEAEILARERTLPFEEFSSAKIKTKNGTYTLKWGKIAVYLESDKKTLCKVVLYDTETWEVTRNEKGQALTLLGFGGGAVAALDFWQEITEPVAGECNPINQLIKISDDWLPTSKNINALPDPLRQFIHDLETLCDPAGIVRENILMKQENEMLRRLMEETNEF
jgi:hypothetical protein